MCTLLLLTASSLFSEAFLKTNQQQVIQGKSLDGIFGVGGLRLEAQYYCAIIMQSIIHIATVLVGAKRGNMQPKGGDREK